MPRLTFPVPIATKAWLQEAGIAGLRHALAESFGDVATRWRVTGLPLFDPTFRTGPPLPEVSDPAALYAALHPDRRATGAYYTPDAVVDELVALAGDGAGTVHDPAVGAGAFLLGALRACPPTQRATFAATALFGTDTDDLAVMLAQARVALAAGLDRSGVEQLVSHVRVADALREPPPAVDTILTNPPFLSRLRALTAPDAALATAIRTRLGDDVGPYTDVSVVFLLDALATARRSVGIVLPASVCATRDAAPARARCGSPTHAWTLPEASFADVEVPLVALVFRKGEGGPTRRYASFPPERLPDSAPGAPWNTLLVAPEAAPWTPPEGGRKLGDVARVEADFRDEYYAVKGQITEGGPGVRIVTSGTIDLGRLAWGERKVRIHKQAWLRPTVPRSALHPRQAARTSPAIFVATQTRLLEAAADTSGECIAMTPVLTVIPTSMILFDVLAVLLSPSASAWAQRRGLGSGLHLDVIKLSASQLRELPLPATIPVEAREAAAAVAAGEFAALDRLAMAMNAAYGAPESLMEWWRARR